MNCATYTNSNTLAEELKANKEAFHQRLQRLYPCVDDVSKLPQAWSPESKAPSIRLIHGNLGCYLRGNGRHDDDEKFAAAVRTDHYIPPSCLLYYFEIKFVCRGREGFMGLGLTSAQAMLTKLPGWARESYGYHADDGNIFNGDGRGNPFGPTFTTGDVIGCGFNLVEGKCFFTKNGLNLGKAFDDIPSNILFYPTIGLKTNGEEIRANFGQEDFVYDIEQDLRSLRKNMTFTISNYPISDFGSLQNTLHKLVQSWLLQNSYPNTADAFTRSTKIECKENLQRIHRRNRIQQLVLKGKISEAVKLTNSLCPNLLQNNPNLLFALKCRQFIELISGAESDFQPVIKSSSSADSGKPSSIPTNGIRRIDSKGDQLDSPVHRNGCNGMIGNNNCDKSDDQQSSSSASLHELMDVDQPMAISPIVASETHHRNLSSSSNSNNNHSSQSANINKQNTNGTNGSDLDLEADEQKSAKLIQFGEELFDYLKELDKLYGKNEINEKMLQDAIGLIAFTNPQESRLGQLLDPSEREPISQLLNSSIVKAEMGDSCRLPLEEVMNHLRKLVRLNDSHGGWLLDKLY